MMHAFHRYCFTENTQPSHSFNRKLGGVARAQVSLESGGGACEESRATARRCNRRVCGRGQSVAFPLHRIIFSVLSSFS